MKSFKYIITRVMVAMAAIALAISCGGGSDEEPVEPQLPNLKLKLEVSDVTSTTAKIKVTHDFDASDTWCGFLTDDITTDAATLIAANTDELHRSKQYIKLFENLTPDTNYRYIAVGMTVEGTTYGEISSINLKTLAEEGGDEPEDYNGMQENEAWSVMYIGEDDIEGKTYEHVVKVRSTDNNPYSLTIVYAELYDPYQLRDLAEAKLADMMAYVEEFNAAYGTSYEFKDLLYTGTASDAFDLEAGRYRAIAVGYTTSGEVSGLYAVSPEFEVMEATPTQEYLSWLGEWSIVGQNDAVTTVNIAAKRTNKSFYMTGWEGFDDLQIEVEYNAELNSLFFFSQLVAEDYDLSALYGEDYGPADIYFFAGDDDGYYYDNLQGDYYIAIAGILDDGTRAIVRYGVNVPGYPEFSQMFLMAELSDGFYNFSGYEEIPTFISIMSPSSGTTNHKGLRTLRKGLHR